MAENEIFARLAQFGFTPVNDAICVGAWNGYGAALRRFSGRAYYVYLAVRLGKNTKGLKKALNRAVKESGGKLGGGVERVMPNFILYSFSFGKDEDPAARFADRMNAITGALRSNGVLPANTCAVTGAPNPDSLCFLADQNFFGYQPVCAAAVRQNDYAVQAKAEENDLNGSYLTGLVGAVLGTLVGVAVNLLTIFLIQRIFAVLFALVPVAAMFGYRLFKGKTDKVSMVIVIVLSVLAVPLMEFLSTAFFLSKEYAMTLAEALKLTGEYFFESEVLKEALPEMGQLLLFMALGVFIGWRYMSSQLNSTQVKNARLQLDTLRPNPNYQGQ